MNVQGLDSIRLIKLCSEGTGNDIAWQEFYSRFTKKIKHCIIKTCIRARRKSAWLSSQISLIPTQELDDLTQQLWLRLMERECLLLKRFSGTAEADVWAYLAVIAKSVVLDHYRNLRRKKRPQIECSWDRLAETRADRLLAELGPTWESLEAWFFRKELIERIEAIIQARYSSHRDSSRALTILSLYFCSGFTVDEISKCQGIDLSRSGVANVILMLKRYIKASVKNSNF